MLHVYCPEIGEKEPSINKVTEFGHLKVIKQEQIEIAASIGHYGDWYLRTKKDLKGRGIKLVGEHEGVKIYKLTDLAFRKLETQYDIKMKSLLD